MPNSDFKTQEPLVIANISYYKSLGNNLGLMCFDQKKRTKKSWTDVDFWQ